MRGDGRETHIIRFAIGNQRDKSTESLILRLFSEPLPFTPAIGYRGVIGAFVGQIDRPHDPGIVIRCDRLIFQRAEVSPPAVVSIHCGTERAPRLVITNGAIIGDDAARGAEETTSPIHHLVVLLSRTENVPAPAEPAQLALRRRIAKHVTIVVAVGAVAVGQEMPADHVEPARVRPEDKVFAAGIAHSFPTVVLKEIIEDDVVEVGLTVVDRLLANHIKPRTELTGHDLSVCRSSEKTDSDIIDAFDR